MKNYVHKNLYDEYVLKQQTTKYTLSQAIRDAQRIETVLHCLHYIMYPHCPQYLILIIF